MQKAYSVELITYEKIVNNGAKEFLIQHNGGFTCGAISGNSKTLVTGGQDSVIRVFDLFLKKQKFVLLGHNMVVMSIALAGDEQYIISGSFDTSVRVWNLQQKSQCALLKGHKGAVNEICYLEQQFFIISADSLGEIIVWDFINFAILKKLNLSVPLKKI